MGISSFFFVQFAMGWSNFNAHHKGFSNAGEKFNKELKEKEAKQQK